MKREGQKRDVFERYIGEIAMACNAINGVDTENSTKHSWNRPN